MSVKQDRHGARTVSDIERKYRNLPTGLEAAQKAASNANRAAESANKAAANAVDMQTFLAVTNQLQSQIDALKNGAGEITEVYGGEKTVGDTWNIMSAKMRYLYTFKSITGGLEFSEESGAIYLTATEAGEATVMIAANDGSRVDRWTFNIVEG